MFKMMKRFPWIALGAAGTWFFFDTEHGAERRAQARLRLREMFGTKPSDPDVIPTPDVISTAG